MDGLGSRMRASLSAVASNAREFEAHIHYVRALVGEGSGAPAYADVHASLDRLHELADDWAQHRAQSPLGFALLGEPTLERACGGALASRPGGGGRARAALCCEHLSVLRLGRMYMEQVGLLAGPALAAASAKAAALAPTSIFGL